MQRGAQDHLVNVHLAARRGSVAVGVGARARAVGLDLLLVRRRHLGVDLGDDERRAQAALGAVGAGLPGLEPDALVLDEQVRQTVDLWMIFLFSFWKTLGFCWNLLIGLVMRRSSWTLQLKLPAMGGMLRAAGGSWQWRSQSCTVWLRCSP